MELHRLAVETRFQRKTKLSDSSKWIRCLPTSISHYWQIQGIDVFALVRWGSRDTYTTDVLPEPIAFAGIPHDSIIVISTYGCIKTKDDKYHFEAGLDACLRALTPKIVLVHGAMPEKVFGPYLKYAEFHNYPDWITRKKGGKRG